MKLTHVERLRGCLKDEAVRPPRLEAMAGLLKEAGYEVWVRDTTVVKDTKIAGTRLRHPGTRDYEGKILEVRVSLQSNRKLINHNTAETYRTNRELAGKVAELLDRKRIVCEICANGHARRCEAEVCDCC